MVVTFSLTMYYVFISVICNFQISLIVFIGRKSDSKRSGSRFSLKRTQSPSSLNNFIYIGMTDENGLE